MSKKKKRLRFPCTDTGNAELIVALFGNELRYDHKQGRWLIWDKHRRRWSEDRTEEVRTFAILAARRRRKDAVRLTDAETSKLQTGITEQDMAESARILEASKNETKWGFDSENRHRVDAALEIAKSLSPISDPGDGWDANPWLLGVSNGVVDLQTGRVREEQPEDRITKHSPVRYDPDAKCPRFEQFLGEIFNKDAALVGYMQRTIGYCLTGLVQEQCVFCWYGAGANGKTTLSVVLRYIFGDHAINLPFSALEIKNRNSNDLVALAGARLATAAETNEGVRLNEARIKVLTGGDPITARRLYHESFTFEPTHKLVLAFNHKPIIADDSEGMWRRVRLIPFTRQFKLAEQDKNLPDALNAEAAGILAWAVRGCQLWQKEGLGMPPAVAEATDAYREESDHVGEFIEDCCVVEPGATVTSGALWRCYQQWAAQNEEVPLSRQILAERLEKRGVRRGRSGHGGTRTWVGIGLVESKRAQCPADSSLNGDMVTEGDALSDNSSMSDDIGKFSESTSPSVSTSALKADRIERLLQELGNKPGPWIDWDAPGARQRC